MIDADYTGSAKERNKNLQTQFALEYNIPYVKGAEGERYFLSTITITTDIRLRGSFKEHIPMANIRAVYGGRCQLSGFAQDNRRESERVDMQFQTNYNRTFGNPYHRSYLCLRKTRRKQTG